MSDGTPFAASWPPDPPFQIQLNYMMKGWSEGVQLMTPGARFKLTIPPKLGFGTNGAGMIPPDATLIFEIELIGFEAGPQPLPVPAFTPIDESKLTSTTSGLKYRVLEEGAATPKRGQKVAINHAIWLPNGELLFSSYELGRTETFTVGGPAVEGWTEGIALMKEGSTYVLVIPPNLGYGARTSGKIPANSTLVWRIELVKVLPGESNSRPEDARDGLSFITIEEAKKHFDLGVPFFDARFHTEFEEGHVKGAVLLIPTDDSVIDAETKPEWLKKFDPRSLAIVYCNGGDCDSSKIVAAQLRKFGFTKVKSFDPGFWGWKREGIPHRGK